MSIAFFMALLTIGAPDILQGQVWQKVNDTLDRTIYCFFENDGVLFAGASSIGLFRSTDHGVEWSNASFRYQKVVEVAEHQGYLFAATSGTGMYRSSDNGLSWLGVRNGLEGLELLSVGSSGTAVFAGSENDGMYRSTDNGDSWVHISNGLKDYWGITCFQVHKGYFFAGTSDGVWRTTNDGDLWTRVNGMKGWGIVPYGFAVFNDILFVASGEGLYRWDSERDTLVFSNLTGVITGVAGAYGQLLFAATGSSGVLVSRDTGETWEHINTGLTNLKMTALGQYNGRLYAAAEGGGIWTLPVSSFLGVNEETEARSVSSDLRIHPNPASERATVRYGLGKPSHVTITLHDALGRIISQPVADAVQEVGEHEIMLETEGLAAGVYLCSVNAGGVERAVRFVVVR